MGSMCFYNACAKIKHLKGDLKKYCPLGNSQITKVHWLCLKLGRELPFSSPALNWILHPLTSMAYWSEWCTSKQISKSIDFNSLRRLTAEDCTICVTFLNVQFSSVCQNGKGGGGHLLSSSTFFWFHLLGFYIQACAVRRRGPCLAFNLLAWLYVIPVQFSSFLQCN